MNSANNIDTYTAYLETELSCKAYELDEIKAAATILLIKLNLNKLTIKDGILLDEILKRKPLTTDAVKLIKEWY